MKCARLISSPQQLDHLHQSGSASRFVYVAPIVVSCLDSSGIHHRIRSTSLPIQISFILHLPFQNHSINLFSTTPCPLWILGLAAFGILLGLNTFGRYGPLSLQRGGWWIKKSSFSTLHNISILHAVQSRLRDCEGIGREDGQDVPCTRLLRRTFRRCRHVDQCALWISALLHSLHCKSRLVC